MMESSNPQFMWVEEIDVLCPQELSVEISVWSASLDVGTQEDIYLGSTTIDFEQRCVGSNVCWSDFFPQVVLDSIS